MKRINLLWIIWIFVTLEFKDVACVSYPGVYRNEVPIIVPGASPIETAFVTERYGINYECIETCYPILNLCDDKCSVMPELPECLQCQRLPDIQPTPIIIETPPFEPIPPYEPISPYEPIPSSFDRPVTPIVSYPLPLPRPPLFPKPNPPNVPIFPSPPRPFLPEVSLPPAYELMPPTPTLPDIPQPPDVQPLKPDLPKLPIVPPVPVPPEVETEIPPQVTVPDVPLPNIFEEVTPELPPAPILPHVPQPPQYENRLPPLPKLPEPPQLKPSAPILPEIPLPPQPILPEVPLPQLEIDLPPQPMLPDMEIYSQLQPELPYVPMPHKYPEFVDEFPNKVPSITIYEPPQTPVMQPVIPEIVRIPSPVSPEKTIIVTAYPDNPEQPIVTEYRDICSDYCLQKRNISECEICLKTGVPADHLELCSNCLVNPSEPDCELCYPILFNLCREFCIFEENEPDCSMCYPQPIILTEEVVNTPVPILPTPIEYCPEYCALTPMSPECEGCGIGVEVIEKVCIDICAGYCLDNPNDEQCAVCYSEDIPDIVQNPVEWPTLEVINYQCCYGDYCTPMPRNGICPVVCKDQCTTACSNDCFNPTCPDCQEIVALNEYQRTQFMIWLKSKLSDMKSRYMAMIEACIRRTELMYERELQAIEMEVDTSLALA
ncbi:calphotin-like [Bradysia coprophila]|uniref:calphotin-like n=1 Tax=Bradysia coprophila TaxID=38358 RepID=UPI00187D9B38|nr:calphotin-like [Bradysia coprophila]